MTVIQKNPAVFLGFLITLIFMVLGFVRVDFLDKLEYGIYDFTMGFRGETRADQEIIIVDIDDVSISRIGRWPWSRAYIAEGLEKISGFNPKIIGLNIIFSEEDSGADLLMKFERLVGAALGEGRNVERTMEVMKDIRLRLDEDRRLAEALASSGKVVLPVFFEQASLFKEGTAKHKDLIQQIALTTGDDFTWRNIPQTGEIQTPLPIFMKASKGLGHVNLYSDTDGKVRREQLLLNYKDHIIPSFTLELAAIFLNTPKNMIEMDSQGIIRLGLIEVPVNQRAEFMVSFKGAEGSFLRYSYFDVINDRIPAGLLEGRIVIISPSAAGIMNPLNTTMNDMSLAEYSANVIWSILHQRFIKVPAYGQYACLGLILLIGIIISLLLPRLKSVLAFVCFLGLLAALVGGTMLALIMQGLWIQTAYPLIQLVIGYIGVVTLSYFVTETKKEKVEGESADTNRMLGLSFQSQGMLDMAFDKLRKVPVTDDMKDILYNLALDYERKRQFNKAASVYAYIEEYDRDYKDVSKKKDKLLQASESMVFGDSFFSGSSDGDPLLTMASDTRPTLGRYEIIKQLGKGAMGIVYLGQDPRINRTTAIKTFRFSSDFEPEEVEKLKVKFFREAESAGTLSHPHIVTIYDAGEEQELAYIAMEYLEGEDLSKYTKKQNLIPMRKVLDYVADIAEALDYAHKQGVVHRDIKPANIMMLKSGIVKVTDFGIARITATSQTQTGVVKGTPHYMSPEQISGEKVDGRSDIFSLGVMLFQLLTGALPFKGDSPAALMHQIMNKAHPDPRSHNPKLPKPITAIIDKALAKDREKRYQTAGQMAGHLRTLGQKLDTLKSMKTSTEQ